MDLTGISGIYRDSSGKLWTDVTLETALNATIGETSAQVEALDSNTVTIGSTEFVKLTASTLEAEDTDGKKLLLSDGILYKMGDAPESTNVTVTDVPDEQPSETPSEEPSEEPSENP